jgi:hypothetical protein
MCIRVVFSQAKKGCRAWPSGDELLRALQELLVRRLHALAVQRPGVGAALLAPGAEARVLGLVVDRRGHAVEHAARPVALR